MRAPQTTPADARITRRSLLGGAAAGALVAAAGTAGAQGYPKGPVKIIVGVGPGSSPDVISRIVGDHLGRLWGQQILILNQPGGGGAISIRAAGNSAPDGHTLFMSLASNYVALPELQASFPFDVGRDFVPIGFVAEQPILIGANPALGLNTLAEAIALAKRRPGELNVAAGNRGSILHLTAEWLRTMAGIDVTIVNYPALPQALADLVAGRIHLNVDAMSGSAGLIRNGTIKALAVAAGERLPNFPDIPLASETLPGLVASGWLALVAPPKTPDAIARKVSDDLRTVLARPDAIQRLHELGSYPRPMSPTELADFIADQQRIWKPILTAIGMKTPK
jgi:tripartite-type tricarboxylate transporter receptor subunit TctC